MKNTILFIIFSFFCSNIFAQSYLLKPTGKYAIGFQDFRFVNGTKTKDNYTCAGKTDLLYIQGNNENDFGQDNQKDFCREIMVRIYYPTLKNTLPYANYYKPAINFLQENIKKAKLPITEEQIKELESIKTFTVDFGNKKSDIVEKKFPVLLFDPGSGVEAQLYENNIANLVSHGYIVIGINNTFVGSSIQFPDGRIVHNLDNSLVNMNIMANSVLNDILFIHQRVINKDNSIISLIDHMELNHIGVFGHSLGGIGVVQAVRRNPDFFQGAVAYDAPPVGFGTRSYSEAEMAGFKNTPILRFFGSEWRSLSNIPSNAKFELFANNYFALLSPSADNIIYTGHMSFSDFSTLQDAPAVKSWLSNGAILSSGSIFGSESTLRGGPILGTANGWFVSKIINDYTLQFFNQYLKNELSDNFNSCAAISKDTLLECGIIKNL